MLYLILQFFLSKEVSFVYFHTQFSERNTSYYDLPITLASSLIFLVYLVLFQFE